MHVSEEMRERARCNLVVFKIGVEEVFSVRFLLRHMKHLTIECSLWGSCWGRYNWVFFVRCLLRQWNRSYNWGLSVRFQLRQKKHHTIECSLWGMHWGRRSRYFKLSALCEVRAEAEATDLLNWVFSVRYVLRQMKQILQLSVLCEVSPEADETGLTIECSRWGTCRGRRNRSFN